MSQEKLAEAAGVKYQSVQEWERENGTAPARKRAQLVAKALGVSHQELLTGVTESLTVVVNPHGEDARAGKLAALFYWLTEEQKIELLGQVQSMADANRAITSSFPVAWPPLPMRGLASSSRRSDPPKPRSKLSN